MSAVVAYLGDDFVSMSAEGMAHSNDYGRRWFTANKIQRSRQVVLGVCGCSDAGDDLLGRIRTLADRRLDHHRTCQLVVEFMRTHRRDRNCFRKSPALLGQIDSQGAHLSYVGQSGGDYEIWSVPKEWLVTIGQPAKLRRMWEGRPVELESVATYEDCECDRCDSKAAYDRYRRLGWWSGRWNRIESSYVGRGESTREQYLYARREEMLRDVDPRNYTHLLLSHAIEAERWQKPFEKRMIGGVVTSYTLAVS